MTLSFALPSLVILTGAILAVTRSNILHAVFGLAISLVGVAGAFFVLGSPFVAVMEVLIYVGGIAVTMIFAVMLSSVASPSDRASGLRQILAALAAGLFAVGGALVITSSELPESNQGAVDSTLALRAMGGDLLTRFNLAFETLSVVLLLAIVGAIVIVRKEPVLPANRDAEAASEQEASA